MKKKKVRFSLLAAAALIFWPYAPVSAVTIEGATPTGTYKQVAVSADGKLLTSAGGANSTSTCNLTAFSTVSIGSATATQFLPAASARSQSLFFIEGPGDLLLSTGTVTFSGSNALGNRVGSPWAKFSSGGTFSIDAPASAVGLIYALASPVGGSTYTVVSLTTCGN